MREEILVRIRYLYRDKGGLTYGEDVSQLSHALQTAAAAERRQAPEAIVIACLLHDIGHLLHQADEHVADAGIDMKHEVIGEKFLARWFPADVTRPIGLHVAAKRYLCAIDGDYLKGLSGASSQSLALQGGPMAPDDVDAFQKDPHFRGALMLRICDDDGKAADAELASFDGYLPMMARLLAKVPQSA